MNSPWRADDPSTNDGALDFVRFCYRRRRVGWPELYDEMCAVAARGHYRGWGFIELADHGLGFGLAEMPRLAALVGRVQREDVERRHRLLVGLMAHASAPVPVPIESGDPQTTEEAVARLLATAAH